VKQVYNQFRQYVAVGAWNTLFGYATYSGLTALLTPRIRAAYIPASLLSSVVNITAAFLAYKWIVFRTKGNYLREWARCVAVYGLGTVIGIALLPILVLSLKHFAGLTSSAPYIAGAMLSALTVVGSFIGNKRFSFSGDHR
jgi:putative flippase GtrA